MVFRAEVIKGIDLDYYLKDLANGDWPLECLLTLKHKGYFMKETMGCYLIHDSGVSRKIDTQAFFKTRVKFMRRIRLIAEGEYRRYISACIGRVYILHFKD